MKSAMVREGLCVVAYSIPRAPYDVGVGHLAGLCVVGEIHVHESILLRRWGARRACAKGPTAAFILLVYRPLSRTQLMYCNRDRMLRYVLGRAVHQAEESGLFRPILRDSTQQDIATMTSNPPDARSNPA
jgi:hypothetical protein